MSRKQQIIIGLLSCMAGLLLMHQHLLFIGLPLFLLGFYLTNKRR